MPTKLAIISETPNFRAVFSVFSFVFANFVEIFFLPFTYSMKKLNSVLLISMLALAPAAMARVEMPAQLGDNAVLQQQADVRLWGRAKAGSQVEIAPSWTSSKTVVKAGSDGRWQATVATPAASYTPYEITVTDGDGPAATMKNVLVGEVWIASGQSNMEMPLRGFWTQPIEGAQEEIVFSGEWKNRVRMATVPKRRSYTVMDTVSGSWQVPSPGTTPEFSALAWHFAKSLNRILDVPVGVIACAYGGSSVESWLPQTTVDSYPGWSVEREKNDPDQKDWERASAMYNAMQQPIAGYTARGFIWNQGETNVGRHAEFVGHMSDLIAQWRKDWGNPDMPFYQTQLPGWDYSDVDATNAALLREAQARCAETVPNGGFVCTIDLTYPYESKDIHACQKKPIGERMAMLAAKDTYKVDGMPYSYPSFKSMKVDGKKAHIELNDAWNGLTPNNTPLEGFQAAGSDGVYHPARAVVRLNTLGIDIECDDVERIVNVRYAFTNFPRGERVRDLMGMPLLPFRTDNFEK